MKSWIAVLGIVLLSCASIWGAGEPKLLTNAAPLPVALDPDFQFRKTKLFLLTEEVLTAKGSYQPEQSQDQGPASGGGVGKAGKLSNTAPSTKTAPAQDASIMFERQYRFFGAVTKLDRRQRYGNYFDFFWRAKRAAPITVRLEYRQEKLHAHVQAQEIPYENARGDIKNEFKGG